MALTYPLSLPDRLPVSAVQWRPVTNVEQARSPFTFERQTYVHQGQMWAATINLPPMRRDRAEMWVGFVLGLNGVEGTFLMGPPAYPRARGVATGTPLVMGAGQAARTLVTDGWTPNVAGILRAGDFIQLGSGAASRLHKLVQDAASNGSGQATLEIWPRLRSAPADDAPLTVTAPKGVWQLASNESMGWDIGLAMLYGLTLDVVESL
jgi:hypothetical protein